MYMQSMTQQHLPSSYHFKGGTRFYGEIALPAPPFATRRFQHIRGTHTKPTFQYLFFGHHLALFVCAASLPSLSFRCLLTSPPHKKRTLRAGHPLWPLHTARRLLDEHALPLPQKSRSSNALGSARNSLSSLSRFPLGSKPRILGSRLSAAGSRPGSGP